MRTITDLPIGAKVKFGRHSINGETPHDIIWLVVHNDGYAPTLLTKDVIDFRAFDAMEQSTKKNSDYEDSNILSWLNTSGNGWFIARHEGDTPPNSSNVQNGGEYESRPGFLTHFTDEETWCITGSFPSPRHRCGKSDDVFSFEDMEMSGITLYIVNLPSVAQLNVLGKFSDECWEYFKTADPRAYPTSHAVTNTRVSSTSINISDKYYHPYLTSDPWNYDNGTAVAAVARGDYYLGTHWCYDSTGGVRPYVQIDGHSYVTDGVDEDGCYQIIRNQFPSKPVLTVPEIIYGGQTVSIQWTPSVDPEGTSITYRLYVDWWNAGGKEQSETIKGLTSTSASYTVSREAVKVKFSVNAYDATGVSNLGFNDVERTVTQGDPPVISGEDSNLGVKSSAFTMGYSVDDPYDEGLTIAEAIDGEIFNTYTTSGDTEGTLRVTGATWLKLNNGTHTLVITATNKVGAISRTYTFEKRVTSCSITSEPMVVYSQPTRISLHVIRNIPEGATFNVYVCNNAMDGENAQVWEDATQAVIEGYVHVFENQTKTATEWAVAVRAVVNRGSAEGDCYISSIGGTFE